MQYNTLHAPKRPVWTKIQFWICPLICIGISLAIGIPMYMAVANYTNQFIARDWTVSENDQTYTDPKPPYNSFPIVVFEYYDAVANQTHHFQRTIGHACPNVQTCQD